MKKLLSLLVSLLLLTGYCFAATTNSYDKYGSKTDSYRTTGSTVTQYDKYGSKTGSYRQTSSGYNSYDKNVRHLVWEIFP